MTPDETPTLASVDTNVFVSSFISLNGPPAAVADAFRARRFLLITSAAQREELERVLRRPKLRAQFHITDEEVDDLLAMIDLHAVFVTHSPTTMPLVRDPKDQMIPASAMAGDARFLVTGDEDLRALATSDAIENLRIVTPAEFLILLDDL